MLFKGGARSSAFFIWVHLEFILLANLDILFAK